MFEDVKIDFTKNSIIDSVMEYNEFNKSFMEVMNYFQKREQLKIIHPVKSEEKEYVEFSNIGTTLKAMIKDDLLDKRLLFIFIMIGFNRVTQDYLNLIFENFNKDKENERKNN